MSREWRLCTLRGGHPWVRSRSSLLPCGEAVKLGRGRNRLCKNASAPSPERVPFSPVTSLSPEVPLQVGPGHEEVAKDWADPPPAPVLTWQVGVMAT